jgi:multidrug efflux pump
VSTVLSAFNSLTLSPALAALLLRPRQARPDPFQRLLNLLLGWFFALFNGLFTFSTGLYARIVGGLLRVALLVLVIYGGLLFLTAYTFSIAPTGYIPLQDKGWLLVDVRLPDSASVQRTAEVMKKVADIAHNTEGIANTITVAGQSFLMGVKGSNYGSMFIVLKPFAQRRKPELNGFALFFHLRQVYAETIREGVVSVFPAPPVNGLGIAGGFKVMIEDRSGLGPTRLADETNQLVEAVASTPEVVNIQSLFQAGVPQLFADIDRVKTRSLGVAIEDVSQALQVFLGSLYVNNFTAFGRTWQVQVQAEPAARNHVNDIGRIHVRNKSGNMVPLATLIDVQPSNGPAMITRYNLYAAAPVTGNAAPTYSTSEVIQLVGDLAKETLPRSMTTEWTELTFMQIRAGNTALLVFTLGVVCVFLVLAALYESWGLPLAVILVVPLCLLCSVSVILAIPVLDVNILTQIGFVVLVGLASKNAILIVEFAKQLREEGKPLGTAVTTASRLRLRPILMTSFAFLFGVWPLVVAVGAASEMRKTLGIAVFSGMLGVTLFGIFLTPVFFYVIQRMREGLGPVPRSNVRRFGHSILFGLTLGLPFLLRHLFPRRLPQPDTDYPEKSP